MWIYFKITFVFEFLVAIISVSHDASEIILIYWFAAQETFLNIISVENSCAASYFCGTIDTEKKRKRKTFTQQGQI